MIRIFEKCLIFVVIILLFLVSANRAMAVTVTINSFPSTIDSLDQYQVSATISGATNATNYLRADLYKDGTSNYFGETYNGSDWYNGGDGKSFYPIQIQNSSASATFYFQLGNPSSTQYLGPGTYKLKIRRYTSSGSASSNDNQVPVDVQINYVFATDTPSPTETPTPEPTQVIATPPPRTATPTPLPTPTKTPTPTPTVTLDPTESPEDSSSSGDVLGISDFSPDPSQTPESTTSSILKNKNTIIAAILVGLGIVMIVGAIYLAFRTSKHSKLQNDI